MLCVQDEVDGSLSGGMFQPGRIKRPASGPPRRGVRSGVNSDLFSRRPLSALTRSPARPASAAASRGGAVLSRKALPMPPPLLEDVDETLIGHQGSPLGDVFVRPKQDERLVLLASREHVALQLLSRQRRRLRKARIDRLVTSARDDRRNVRRAGVLCNANTLRLLARCFRRLRLYGEQRRELLRTKEEKTRVHVEGEQEWQRRTVSLQRRTEVLLNRVAECSSAYARWRTHAALRLQGRALQVRRGECFRNLWNYATNRRRRRHKQALIVMRMQTVLLRRSYNRMRLHALMRVARRRLGSLLAEQSFRVVLANAVGKIRRWAVLCRRRRHHLKCAEVLWRNNVLQTLRNSWTAWMLWTRQTIFHRQTARRALLLSGHAATVHLRLRFGSLVAWRHLSVQYRHKHNISDALCRNTESGLLVACYLGWLRYSRDSKRRREREKVSSALMVGTERFTRTRFMTFLMDRVFRKRHLRGQSEVLAEGTWRGVVRVRYMKLRSYAEFKQRARDNQERTDLLSDGAEQVLRRRYWGRLRANQTAGRLKKHKECQAMSMANLFDNGLRTLHFGRWRRLGEERAARSRRGRHADFLCGTSNRVLLTRTWQRFIVLRNVAHRRRQRQRQAELLRATVERQHMLGCWVRYRHFHEIKSRRRVNERRAEILCQSTARGMRRRALRVLRERVKLVKRRRQQLIHILVIATDAERMLQNVVWRRLQALSSHRRRRIQNTHYSLMLAKSAKLGLLSRYWGNLKVRVRWARRLGINLARAEAMARRSERAVMRGVMLKLQEACNRRLRVKKRGGRTMRCDVLLASSHRAVRQRFFWKLHEKGRVRSARRRTAMELWHRVQTVRWNNYFERFLRIVRLRRRRRRAQAVHDAITSARLRLTRSEVLQRWQSNVAMKGVLRNLSTVEEQRALARKDLRRLEVEAAAAQDTVVRERALTAAVRADGAVERETAQREYEGREAALRAAHNDAVSVRENQNAADARRWQARIGELEQELSATRGEFDGLRVELKDERARRAAKEEKMQAAGQEHEYALRVERISAEGKRREVVRRWQRRVALGMALGVDRARLVWLLTGWRAVTERRTTWRATKRRLGLKQAEALQAASKRVLLRRYAVRLQDFMHLRRRRRKLPVLADAAEEKVRHLLATRWIHALRHATGRIKARRRRAKTGEVLCRMSDTAHLRLRFTSLRFWYLRRRRMRGARLAAASLQRAVDRTRLWPFMMRWTRAVPVEVPASPPRQITPLSPEQSPDPSPAILQLEGEQVELQSTITRLTRQYREAENRREQAEDEHETLAHQNDMLTNEITTLRLRMQEAERQLRIHRHPRRLTSPIAERMCREEAAVRKSLTSGEARMYRAALRSLRGQTQPYRKVGALGVTVATPLSGGVVVTKVHNRGPAEKAGLRNGDRVSRVTNPGGSFPVHSAQDFLVHTGSGGQCFEGVTVTLTIIRDHSRKRTPSIRSHGSASPQALLGNQMATPRRASDFMGNLATPRRASELSPESSPRGATMDIVVSVGPVPENVKEGRLMEISGQLSGVFGGEFNAAATYEIANDPDRCRIRLQRIYDEFKEERVSVPHGVVEVLVRAAERLGVPPPPESLMLETAEDADQGQKGDVSFEELFLPMRDLFYDFILHGKGRKPQSYLHFAAPD
eukprot:Hpha_TRINITY_DN22191_c0_g1::TRINITY_DN22191_c0_g1_i1::g.103577::m.103577